MIGRIWHGWTSRENASAFEELVKSEILPEIAGRRLRGLLGAHLLKRDVSEEVEFVTILWFESLDAVREFAGEDYEAAVVPEKARRLLTRFDARSAHYETLLSPWATAPGGLPPGLDISSRERMWEWFRTHK
jgi:heme-degrading monooxygenase HmoA